jgi:alpha-beta hydrolase superfamily lysophospholipase
MQTSPSYAILPVMQDVAATHASPRLRPPRRRTRWLFVAVALLLVIPNLLAWNQAWAMTHYAARGQRTAPPERLSLVDKIGAILLGVTVPRPANSSSPAQVGLSFEMRTILVDDGRLEVWYATSQGGRGVVLMFPAYAESKSSLLQSARAIADLGFDTLMVDFRGVGGSTGSDTTLGIKEARDIAAAFRYARQEWPGRPIALYGVSMGAVAALRAVAAKDVRPDALILESPFDSLLNTVRNRFHATGLPDFPAAEMLVFWGGVQHGFDGFAHNPVEYARSVRCPTLLLYGDRDPRVTPGQSRAIYDALDPGIYRRAVAFKGAGHEALVLSDPALWRENVDWLLQEAAP